MGDQISMGPSWKIVPSQLTIFCIQTWITPEPRDLAGCRFHHSIPHWVLLLDTNCQLIGSPVTRVARLATVVGHRCMGRHELLAIRLFPLPDWPTGQTLPKEPHTPVSAKWQSFHILNKFINVWAGTHVNKALLSIYERISTGYRSNRLVPSGFLSTNTGITLVIALAISAIPRPACNLWCGGASACNAQAPTHRPHLSSIPTPSPQQTSNWFWPTSRQRYRVIPICHSRPIIFQQFASIPDCLASLDQKLCHQLCWTSTGLLLTLTGDLFHQTWNNFWTTSIPDFPIGSFSCIMIGLQTELKTVRWFLAVHSA